MRCKDDLPAYITWERFLANQERLQQNRNQASSKGSPRNGKALLGGLLFCRRCGSRLVVGCSGAQHRPRYRCMQGYMGYGLAKCQSLSASPLDDFIGGQIMHVLKPATVELSLKAVEHTKQEHGRQMKGAHSRWLLWADEDELNRLTKLRQHRQTSSGQPVPTELTTPKTARRTFGGWVAGRT